MDCKPVTVDDVLETLSVSESEEVQRDDFSIPLKIYLKGFNSKPFMPRDAVIRNMRQFARNRAAVRQAVIRNPDIMKTPIDNPVVVIGIPRSGTTLLQRLLSNDFQFLTPMLWEIVESTPPGRPDNWKDCERFRKAANSDACKNVTKKSLDHIHKLRMNVGVECLYIMRQYFLETLETLPFETLEELRSFMYNCPEDYVKNAYEFHKMSLKCIFYGNMSENKSLLLKGSIHMLYLEALKEAYPNARFVLLYRDIKEVIASYTSLKCKFLEMTNSTEDWHGVALRTMKHLQHTTSRAVQAFQKWNGTNMIAISYNDFVSDPMATVNEIYSKFDLQLTPRSEEAMKRFLVDNPQNKHGKHEYSLEQFGITDEDVQRDMADFLNHFYKSIKVQAEK